MASQDAHPGRSVARSSTKPLPNQNIPAPLNPRELRPNSKPGSPNIYISPFFIAIYEEPDPPLQRVLFGPWQKERPVRKMFPYAGVTFPPSRARPNMASGAASLANNHKNCAPLPSRVAPVMRNAYAAATGIFHATAYKHLPRTHGLTRLLPDIIEEATEHSR